MSAAGPEPFLADLGPGDWAKVVAAASRRTVEPGEVVLALDGPRSLVLLLAGVVTGHAAEAGGVWREVRRHEAPAVLGEVAFLDGAGQLLELRAAERGEVLELSWEAFDALARRDPLLGRVMLEELGRLVAGRLRSATELLRAALGA